MGRKRLVRYAVLFYISLFMLVLHPPTSSSAHAIDFPTTKQKDIDLLLRLQLAETRLIIPRIGVNATIDPVEEGPDGAMAVPTNQPWTHVGWYVNGPYPGEQGSAVIDGHLDRPGGWPAVFWNLHLLRPSDQVFLDTPGQSRLRFRVTKVAIYRPAEAPLSLIFNNTNGHFLNLVTCIGRWISRIHQTTHRLVVYTTLI